MKKTQSFPTAATAGKTAIRDVLVETMLCSSRASTKLTLFWSVWPKKVFRAFWDIQTKVLKPETAPRFKKKQFHELLKYEMC